MLPLFAEIVPPAHGATPEQFGLWVTIGAGVLGIVYVVISLLLKVKELRAPGIEYARRGDLKELEADTRIKIHDLRNELHKAKLEHEHTVGGLRHEIQTQVGLVLAQLSGLKATLDILLRTKASQESQL